MLCLVFMIEYFVDYSDGRNNFELNFDENGKSDVKYLEKPSTIFKAEGCFTRTLMMYSFTQHSSYKLFHAVVQPLTIFALPWASFVDMHINLALSAIHALALLRNISTEAASKVFNSFLSENDKIVPTNYSTRLGVQIIKTCRCYQNFKMGLYFFGWLYCTRPSSREYTIIKMNPDFNSLSEVEFFLHFRLSNAPSMFDQVFQKMHLERVYGPLKMDEGDRLFLPGCIAMVKGFGDLSKTCRELGFLKYILLAIL